MTINSRQGTRARHREATRRGTRTAVLTVALPSAATLGVFTAAGAAVEYDSTRLPAPSSVDGAPATAGATPPDTPRDAAPAPAEPERADRIGTRPELPAPPEPPEPSHYALPVAQPGLSAGFGQAGTHWAVRHTGIDFPVPSGTPVRAATDGTVSTRWSRAYGYLATVTGRDGTTTWYGHLRSYRIRKGPVRAGEVIAYSGSTGNSTGPHLHFEVRPDGGAPVDPLPWLLAHGLDPR
ncbi:M23 family metallopeptidase [Kitasatospora sp. NBC_00374]|uniref:M23 family metallopeptidase n=1 Tax=Kitasatospora sp. NBC_00374 TaxID=2975964 RepID=UPI00324C7EEA